MPQLTLPALVDAHVHFREPGGTQKEDFASGSRAALAGGISAILEMPNTQPPTVDAASFEEKARIAARSSYCDYGLFVGATADNALPAMQLGRRAAGLKVYMGHTFGPLILPDLPALLRHFATWAGPGPIVIHAEGTILAAGIALAQAYRQPTHIAHVSTAAAIELIARAKAAGAPITCEVAPHHLLLNASEVERQGAFAAMKPALGADEDVAALWHHLDAIDVFATDHAPHTREEKQGENPPPGVPGVETMLPLLLTTVAEGRLSMDGLVARLHTNPARIFRLALPPAETVVDTEARWTIGDEPIWSRAGWTPYAGMQVQGRLRELTLRGQVVYRDGQVLAPAGFGRDLRA